MDREPLARKLVTDRLAQSGAPEVTTFECPGIDEAEVRQVVSCYVGLTKGCIIEIGMPMTATGFEIAQASANSACDQILNPEG